MCVKELFVRRFDPMTVSYAALSGMQTFLIFIFAALDEKFV